MKNYEQFLLLPQYFQKSSAAEALKSACMWERSLIQYQINLYYIFIWHKLVLTLPLVQMHLMCLLNETMFKNILAEGEISTLSNYYILII